MMSIKKVCLAILCMIIVFTSCEKEETKSIDAARIAELEKAKYLFDNYKMTYDEYKKIYQVTYTSDHNLDDEIILAKGLGWEGKGIILGKELIGLNLEEYKNLAKDFFGDLPEIIQNPPSDITIQISDVYLDNDYDWKYVFTKQKFVDNSYDDQTENYITKRYTFIKEGDQYKVTSVDEDYLFYNKDTPNKLKPGVTKEDLLSLMEYQTKNNEPVEYIITLDMDEEL